MIATFFILVAILRSLRWRRRSLENIECIETSVSATNDQPNECPDAQTISSTIIRNDDKTATGGVYRFKDYSDVSGTSTHRRLTRPRFSLQVNSSPLATSTSTTTTTRRYNDRSRSIGTLIKSKYDDAEDRGGGELQHRQIEEHQAIDSKNEAHKSSPESSERRLCLNDNENDADADDADEDDEDNRRDTEEFYNSIQDCAAYSLSNISGQGTSSQRRKRSSLFSRSDSSATTTSSTSGSGTFTGGKRRSTASIISSSMCSDIIPIDRRSSTECSRASSHRRSSGRIRRYITRMTIAGARRRTTGRHNRILN